MYRLIGTLVLSVVVAAPVSAEMKRPFKGRKMAGAASLRARDAAPDLVAQVMKQYQSSLQGRRTLQKSRRLTPSPDAVTEVRSVRAFIIPVAGNAAGGGGTFFRSDVTLVNNSAVEQDMLSVWIASGVSTTTPPSRVITLDEESIITVIDYVATVQQQSGIGALFFIPIFGGRPDPDAAVDGFSRIWTPQPGVANGTVSQPFDGVDPDSFPEVDLAAALGLRAGDGFRTNWFIVNTSSQTLNFDVLFFGEDREDFTSVSVPPSSLLFRQIPPGDQYGPLAIVFSVDDPQASWMAGGSSTDNVTGDGWVTLASAVFTDDELDDLGQ